MTAQKDQSNAAASVSVVRVCDYEPEHIFEAILRQLELLGGLEKYVSRGDSVLIKPNFITPRPKEVPAQTHPAVIIALAKILKDFGAKPFVGDSPAWGSIEACVEALQLSDPLKHLGVPVRNLDKPKRRRIDGSLVSISQVARQADKIINVPKFKAHQQLGATFAVKNMFGCVCGKRKAFWHFARGKSYDAFCTMLIEIYKFLAPVLSIIDGVVAMEGQGPIRGSARELGFLIAGSDPVACEMICSDLIKLDPAQLPIIQTARKMNFGCSDLSQIELLGDDYRQNKCNDFQFAELTPLDFSLVRVCGSVCRQVVLRAKCMFHKAE